MGSWEGQSGKAAELLSVWPLDESNVTLLDAVHPRDHVDPTPPDVYDLIAIGAGAGGLVSSKQSGRRGARSAMISEHLAGGDCLNVGCVPSKALLHCARMARGLRAATEEGFLVGGGEGGSGAALRVDFGAVMARMRRLRARIAPADSHEATAGAGADVFQGRGRFVGPNTIEVNGQTLRFRKAVIATGGRAAVPDVPGLAEAPYVTNGTLFNLTTLPPRLVVLGAGAVGLEMAQAFAAFGSRVTVLVRSERVLSREEPQAAAAVRAALEADGVTFVCGASVGEVRTLREGGGATDSGALPLLRLLGSAAGGVALDIECETLLVATGRLPNVADLGLEAAGVEYSAADGVVVNDLAQSSNADVYAVGDCCAGVPRFTHVSGEMAKLVVQNALFNDTWKVSSLVIPSCVYTEPEVASVGMTAAAAAAAGVAIDTYSATLEGNDRAILESQSGSGGCAIVHCAAGTDAIVGGSIVAPAAGEMISEITLAMQAGVGLKVIGRVIHPYPTMGEAVMGCGLGFVRKHWEKLPPREA